MPSVKTVLVTGAAGFVGKNLIEALGRREDVRILGYDVDTSREEMETYVRQADFIYHLAGVNRPKDDAEFEAGNAGSAAALVAVLEGCGRATPVAISSSTQAAVENPYGVSKRGAEEALRGYAERTGAPVYIYRLTNIFGKWSRPNYNSVVSTFCYNICHGLDIRISDPAREVELVYIDDVVAEFVSLLDGARSERAAEYLAVAPTYTVTLGDLADRIYALRDIRRTLVVPDLSDPLTWCLNATYLSYLEKDDFSYELDTKTDARGNLAELIKSRQFGQIFVSTTLPGVTRGNHYHNTKVEKFCVIRGEGVIRFRHIFSDEIIEYAVSGKHLQVVDIPPGYTHSIENVSDDEMITLFWANQIFDAEEPDTYFSSVQPEK